MKQIITLFLLFLPLFSISQESKIILKSGEYLYNPSFDLDSDTDKYYRYFIFDKLPTSKQQEELNKLGINLLEYLPKNILKSNDVKFTPVSNNSSLKNNEK